MVRQPDPSRAPSRSTAKRDTAGESERVVGLCAKVLGPLELEIVRDDGSRVPVKIEWRSATEGALRSFIASPNGVQGTRVAQRAGYKSAHDIVSKLRDVLEPVGLSVSRYPGSSGYRLISLSSSEPVDIESDLDQFRGKAEEFLSDGGKRLRAILDSDDEVDISSLRVIEGHLADLLGLWRVQDPEDRIRVLQDVPDASRPSSALKLDGELRVCSIECDLALARAQSAGSRLQSAREGIAHLDRFADPATRNRLVTALGALSKELAENDEARIPVDVGVFLSAPMASVPGEYNPTRQLALKVAESLRADCGVASVYFPGQDVTSEDDFEEPAVSLQKNMGPFGAARHFVMLMPTLVASSVLVEAGMALMLNMPSVYLVHDRKTGLPWMLQDVAGAGVDSLGKVRVIEYKDEADLLRKLKNNGLGLFPA